MENGKQNLDRLCTIHYETSFLHCRLQGKDGCKDDAVFWSTVQDELTRIKNSLILLSNWSTPSLIFFISFVIIDSEFWQWIHKIFKPRLAVTFIFPTCNSCISNHQKFHNLLHHRNFIPLNRSQTKLSVINLIWYFWRHDIKLRNRMKKKITKKRAALGALGNMGNIREKQKHKYVSKFIFPLSTRNLHRSLKEEKKADVWPAKKKIEQPKIKFSTLFKKIC